MGLLILLAAALGLGGLTLSERAKSDAPVVASHTDAITTAFAGAIVASLSADARVFVAAREPYRTALEDALRVQGVAILSRTPHRHDDAVILCFAVEPYDDAVLARAATAGHGWSRLYRTVDQQLEPTSPMTIAMQE